MSRPDDTITPNFGSPQPGHPTGWPKPHDAQARDPITGRPIASQAEWQGGNGYPYPGQDHGQHHYDPAAQAGARPQTRGRGTTAGHGPGGETAPQYGRYPEPPQMPHGYAADQYQAPRPGAHPQGWPRVPGAEHQAYVPPGSEPQWGGDASGYAAAADPRGYGAGGYPSQGQEGHFGNYAQPGPAYADPNAGYQPQGYPDTAYQQAQYGGHEQAYDPRMGQPYAPGGYDPNDPYQQGYAPPDGGLASGQPVAGADEYEAYDEAPPRKRRGLLVVGALVCAVAVGGGLAFVYKTFGQSGKRIGAPPLVAKASTPAKVAPADPQGKQFDNANKKVLSRLDEPAGTATEAPTGGNPPTSGVPGMIVSVPSAPPSQSAQQAGADTSAPSTRTVQTVQIGRDGNPVGGYSAVVTPRGLPGVQIDNSLNAPPPMRGGIPAADVPATPPPAASPPKAQVQRVATPVERPEVVGANPPAAPKRIAVPRAAKEPAAAASAPGSGYVAVLSSQKDRAAALRIYADLAQKYPDQLGARQPEVQEANLGEKGVWQRLVVGPPGSQQSAKELCSQLKAAGYSADCWAKQY